MSAPADGLIPSADELPEVGPGESFAFACHPAVPCFNACCRELDLQLNPYDVLRLRRRLGLSSDEFMERCGRPTVLAPTGFPAVELRMSDEPDRRCPFVAPTGCQVYADRPAACRCYPLGRGVGWDGAGRRVERTCLVREPHCLGFAEPRSWTPRRWLADQGLEPYLAVDDAYLALAARAAARGRRLSEAERGQVALACYQVDRFGARLHESRLCEHLGLGRAEREALAADEARLLPLAIDWLAQVLGLD